MRRFAVVPGFIFFIIIAVSFLAGCGGGSSSSKNNAVTQVAVAPTSLTLNAGDVAQLTATPENSANNGVTANITYNSSNPALVTVSTAGLICAGVWDSNFIDCNGATTNGSPLSGTASITASAGGITSSPVSVTVHPKVTSIVVDPVAGCTSSTRAQQFTAHACSALVNPHDSSGPCAPNAHEISSQIGPFTFATSDSGVAGIDNTGLATANNPGFTNVFATVSNVTSAPAGFRTCMPLEIRLHLQGDPAGSPTTSASMTQNQTLTLEADMTDENGVSKNSQTTLMASDFPSVATISGLTLTATSFGGAGIIAACAPPSCGNGFPQPFPVYSNLFSVTVPGASPAGTLYVTSSFATPNGTLSTLVPITTSTGTAGTALNLPGVPNSMVFSSGGTKAFLGTNAGLVAFDPSANTVTVVDAGTSGKVLAVSSDGTKVLVSNAAKDPQGNVIQPVGPAQRLFAFDQSTSTTQAFVKPGAVAATIGNDTFREYIVTNDGTGNIYVFSPLLSLQTTNIAVTANDVASLPSGPFVFVADSHGLDVIATCNNVQQPTANNPPTHSSTIQLVKPVANADMIVAVDSSGVDVETVTVKSILSTNPTLPFVLSPATCAPPVSYSNQFLDFGIGAFTARQLLVATNGSRVVVLPANTSSVLTAVPGGTPSVTAFAVANGGTQALSGAMTPDGNTLWVGVAGTNTVDKIDLTGGGDVQQVKVSFTKSDGTPAPPDIVALRPQ